MHDIRTVGVIGLGYIGLPTAVALASNGCVVEGVDVREVVVKAVDEGRSHFSEPGLDEALRECVHRGRLRSHAKPVPCDAFIVAVPTPLSEDHTPDLSYVEAAARSIAPILKAGNLVVLESTSPVGTTEELARLLAKARPDLKFPVDRS